jgi:hypothetical protein
MLTTDIGLAVATCEKDHIRSQNKQLQAAYFYFYGQAKINMSNMTYLNALSLSCTLQSLRFIAGGGKNAGFNRYRQNKYGVWV